MARKKKLRFEYPAVFFLIVAFLGLIAGFFLAKRNQYFASLALTPQSVGEVKLVWDQEPLDQTGNVRLVFRTGTNEGDLEAVSTISIKLDLPPGLQVVSKDGQYTEKITPNREFIDSGDWSFPVNKVEVLEDKTVIEFMAVNEQKDGFSSFDYIDLAGFSLAGLGEVTVFDYEYDAEMSSIFSKRRPVTDIWK